MTDAEIIEACRRHGAKAVGDAAYAAMERRPAAAQALGIGALVGNLAGLYRVTVLAFELMGHDDRAADLTHATIAACKLPELPGATDTAPRADA